MYCVTKVIPKLKAVEDLDEGIYFIFHKDLHAIATKVSGGEFNEENLKRNLANFEWVKEKVSIHEKIIEGIMKNACVVPFKFGTIFNTEDSLKACLDEFTPKLKENLRNFEGKEEWGVKIYCDIKKLKEAAVKEDAELLKIDKEIISSSAGKAYFLTKKKEELIKDTINRRINEYGQNSFQMLKELSVGSRINKLLPKEVTERKDDMILNSAFLVDKSKVGEFAKVVGELKSKYNNKGLNFDCTGPWPAYNFTTIKKEI